MTSISMSLDSSHEAEGFHREIKHGNKLIKSMNAQTAQKKYRTSILEAATQLAHDFSEHYWKEVLQQGQTTETNRVELDSSSKESIRKGFLLYLNSTGRYLILREHLRAAISDVVHQKCLNAHPSGFQNHKDFQTFLHDMHVFLVDEMNDVLNSSTVHETDPLRNSLDRLLHQANCGEDEDIKASLHQRHITDLGIFAEEAFAQGFYETCHELHLHRISQDKGSARCWTEFAIMWLSRGDERMAETAVKEALQMDPLDVYALIISGVITLRKGDEAGLECLISAAGLRPMSPEIMVILALAYNLLGDDTKSDYYFRKAAYVHRIITGQDTFHLEGFFDERNTHRPFNMYDYIKDMNEGIPPRTSDAMADPLHALSDEEDEDLEDEEEEEEEEEGDDNHHDHFIKTKERAKSRMTHASMIGEEKGTRKSELKHKRSSSLKEKTLSNAGIAEGNGKMKRRSSSLKDKTRLSKSSVKDEMGDMRKSMFQRKSSSAKEGSSSNDFEMTPVESVTENLPRFSFLETLTDILLEEVELPLLAPSIQSPWDVTEFSKHMEHVLLYPVKSGSISNDGSLDGQPNIIKSGSSVGENTLEGDELLNHEPETHEDEIAGQNRLSSEKMKARKSKRKSSNRKSKAKGHSIFALPPIDEEEDDDEEEHLLIPEVESEEVLDSAEKPKLVERLGSELIWTANLLMNLRLFDFLDGVLARQLYFYEDVTIQFIYLRAMSLYLRQREEEALPLVKDILEFDETNGVYWTLEGHCQHNLGNITEAIQCYEKALKLPHLKENRHLLYLRFGSLVLDHGKTKLAKRVFFHGVNKYPTPYMWLALGSACYQRQEYDQAEISFSEANRLDSTNPIIWGHLALSSLMQNKQTLAEQSYKWALRFGLKEGVLLDEIQRVQKEKGFGDPSFPRIPTCLPHQYYLRRMGKQKPFNIYKEALNQDPPRMQRGRFDDTENEALLKRKLEIMANAQMEFRGEEWDGESYYPTRSDAHVRDEIQLEDLGPLNSEIDKPVESNTGKRQQFFKQPGGAGDFVTIKTPPKYSKYSNIGNY